MTSKQQFLLADLANLERELDYIEDVTASLNLQNASGVREVLIGKNGRLLRINNELEGLLKHSGSYLSSKTLAEIQLVKEDLQGIIDEIKKIKPVGWANLRSGMWEWIRDDILVRFRKTKHNLLKLDSKIITEMRW